MHVLTFILQHVNSVTLSGLTMTPYHSQARVMLTLNIIQLLEALVPAALYSPTTIHVTTTLYSRSSMFQQVPS